MNGFKIVEIEFEVKSLESQKIRNLWIWVHA